MDRRCPYYFQRILTFLLTNHPYQQPIENGIFAAKLTSLLHMSLPINFNNTEVAFAYKDTFTLKKAHFIFSLINITWLASFCIGLVKLAYKLHVPINAIVKVTIFDHFCGGESIEKSVEKVNTLFQYRVYTIMDYSAEGTTSEESFENSLIEILHALNHANTHEQIPFCVFKPTALASMDLLAKVHAQELLTDDEERSFLRVKARVKKICSRAHELGVPILIDAEHSWIQQPIDDMAYEMMHMYNQKQPIVYNTFQMYLHQMPKRLEIAYQQGKHKGYNVGVKMVRGAYMEHERQRALEMGYESPVCINKEQTDEQFNRALTYCVEHRDVISLICCSHNENSNQHLVSLMEQYAISHQDTSIWFAQLLGMSDHISFNLANQGYHVAKYVPYGPIEGVMPYLIRRAEENTSVAGQTPRELNLLRAELRRRKS